MNQQLIDFQQQVGRRFDRMEARIANIHILSRNRRFITDPWPLQKCVSFSSHYAVRLRSSCLISFRPRATGIIWRLPYVDREFCPPLLKIQNYKPNAAIGDVPNPWDRIIYGYQLLDILQLVIFYMMTSE